LLSEFLFLLDALLLFFDVMRSDVLLLFFDVIRSEALLLFPEYPSE